MTLSFNRETGVENPNFPVVVFFQDRSTLEVNRSGKVPIIAELRIADSTAKGSDAIESVNDSQEDSPSAWP